MKYLNVKRILPEEVFNIKNINCVIYTISNNIDGKFYVGSSKSFKSRWSHHLNLLNNNNHHCKYLQNAWNKHGGNNFTFKILVSLSHLDDLLITEQRYLNLFFHCLPHKLYNTAKNIGIQRGPDISGEKNPKRKLTNVKVLKIRDEFSKKVEKVRIKYAFLAKKYAVSEITISRIIRHKSWSNI